MDGNPRRAAAPYTRVRDALRAGLAAGRWRPGARLPSEAQLTARFGVSRMTVGRALRELQAAGLIERLQGIGTFAAQPQRVTATLAIRDLGEEIAARGQRHHAAVYLQRSEPAAAAIAAQLGLAPRDRVFHTRIVHSAGGVPLQYEERWVNPAAAPGYLGADFTRTTPTRYLLEVAPLWEGDYAIEAGRASPAEARLLGIGRAEPCLIVRRRTVSRGLPVTLVRLVHPGARYQLGGRLQP